MKRQNTSVWLLWHVPSRLGPDRRSLWRVRLMGSRLSTHIEMDWRLFKPRSPHPEADSPEHVVGCRELQSGSRFADGARKRKVAASRLQSVSPATAKTKSRYSLTFLLRGSLAFWVAIACSQTCSQTTVQRLLTLARGLHATWTSQPCVWYLAAALTTGTANS